MSFMREQVVYTLFSSSGGNCAYFKDGNDEYLIDCGVSARACETALRELGTSLLNIKAVFITHEHIDHIRALETLCKKRPVPVYAPEKCCALIARQMVHASPYLIPLAMLESVETENARFTPFSTPHDSVSSCGYVVETEGLKFGLATDMGYVTKTCAKELCGCKAVIIESNHDIEMLKHGTYPESTKKRILGDFGHLSNKSCASFVPYLALNGTTSIVLAHLSKENNTPRKAFEESFCSLTASGAKVCAALGEGDVRLAVAPGEGSLRVI